jgi:peroxiredoxin Q/BCP
MVKKGENAPELGLSDQAGEEVKLNEFQGKWIVLYFYPKDNTSGCTLEANDFTSALSDFEKMNVQIIGVSPDSIKSHQNFISKHDLGIRLLSDPEHKVLEKYGAWQKKKLYGREFMGVVRSTFLIDPDGKIVHMWPRVKVKGHVDDVKEKIIEMQN